MSDLSESNQFTELDETSLLLLRMADYIEKNGLSCGGMTDHAGRKCVIAVSWLVNTDSTQEAVLYQAQKRIYDAIPGKGIVYWSDNTPAEEVIETLRAVALGAFKEN
jgi:hypothetical protein